MKTLKQIDLAGQLLCVVVPLLSRVDDAIGWIYIVLGGWQIVSSVYWGIGYSRLEKSYGRRVCEKVWLLILGAVIVGLLALLIRVPLIFWMLYFMLYGGAAIMELWYLGITLLEWIKTIRREQH